MKSLIERLTKLLSVKSIVTILLTLVVVVLSLRGQFDIEDIYLMIIAFYFGTQAMKENGKGSVEEIKTLTEYFYGDRDEDVQASVIGEKCFETVLKSIKGDEV